MQKADILLRSNAVFSGLASVSEAGFVAISGNRILAAGPSDGAEYTGPDTQVLDLGERLICPGFTDVHCFFNGYLLTIAGTDLSACQNADQSVADAKAYQKTLVPGATVLARGVHPGFTELNSDRLDQEFGDVPVILFMEGGESCYMNSAARREYHFTPDTCWSESYWRLLKYILGQKEFSVPEFRKYLSMMNSRGITSIKEMGFDDFYGFTKELKKLEQENALTARVHFMSQPVGFPMNLEYGKEMRDSFHGSFVHFSGYNQMTDGSISQLEGEMKSPYLCADTCCVKDIDWEGLRKDTLAADRENFRFSLHAQGDGAICRTMDIFDQCQRGPDGRIKNRHSITDLECSDPVDLERMGALGIVAEIYPQIMSIADQNGKLAMIQEKIGLERGKNYWNRRKMADSGVTISCGTDLPLLYDDIPESIYHTVGAMFPEGGAPFNEENALTVSELLKAWTYGGQYNLGCESQVGTLKAGNLADIAVLDGNVFKTPMDQVRGIKVCLTLVDGKIVHRTI
ncbi:MAG TPA: amidohydrolase [Lachnoclostridium sp.]|uniref:amidohydrolase n=1 Tax=Lacrimispora sp. TaxID=2719234 RepID=UPI000ED284D1|nr:amidohydrolase family protein [Lacrimispora sp.]HCD45505.1 amidohydrolase [Lachnoclostridium sp.]